MLSVLLKFWPPFVSVRITWPRLSQSSNWNLRWCMFIRTLDKCNQSVSLLRSTIIPINCRYQVCDPRFQTTPVRVKLPLVIVTDSCLIDLFGYAHTRLLHLRTLAYSSPPCSFPATPPVCFFICFLLFIVSYWLNSKLPDVIFHWISTSKFLQSYLLVSFVTFPYCFGIWKFPE